MRRPCCMSPLHVFALLLCAATACLPSCSDSAADRAHALESEARENAAFGASTAPTVHPLLLDCWGRKLESQGAAEAWMPTSAGSHTWSFEADGFQSAEVTATWDGTASAEGLSVTANGDALLAVAWNPSGTEEISGPSYSILVGLNHSWFACTGRPPSRNQAQLFTSGETMYSRLAQDLGQATSRIHAVTWWWQSDLELVRTAEQPFMSAQQRQQQTMETLLSSLKVERRVIVERFASQTADGLAYVNTDPALRAHAYDTQDMMEVMVQGNPTPIPLMGSYAPVTHPVPFLTRALEANPELAGQGFTQTTETLAAPLETYVDASSWHQKSWTIDGRIAYVGGMNVKAADWDSDSHGVFDARRMLFKSSNEERQRVVDKLALPDVAPRKDYSVRFEGPIARDVDDVIRLRWEWGRQRNDLFAQWTTPYQLLPASNEVEDGTLVQLVVTMPEPFGERSILESMDKALRNAKDLIYVEDQYFRMPVVLDAFREALANSPDLHVVVVTPDVSITDGAKKWTLIMDEELRKAAGERYLLLRLRSFDIGYLAGTGAPASVFQDINLHSKQVIVDDTYMNVGSCNKNNRGLLLEGEMNVAIFDPRFVAPAKERILGQLTGDVSFDWGSATGAQILEHLAEVAAKNESIRQKVEATGAVPTTPPSGFVYPLKLTKEYLLDVGPDVF